MRSASSPRSSSSSAALVPAGARRARLQELSDRRHPIRRWGAGGCVLSQRLRSSTTVAFPLLIPRDRRSPRVSPRVGPLKIRMRSLTTRSGVLGDRSCGPVRRGLTLEGVAKVEEWKLELPGVIVEVTAAHVPDSRLPAHCRVRSRGHEEQPGRPYGARHVGQSGLERLLIVSRGTEGGSGSRSTPSDADPLSSTRAVPGPGRDDGRPPIQEARARDGGPRRRRGCARPPRRRRAGDGIDPASLDKFTHD